MLLSEIFEIHVLELSHKKIKKFLDRLSGIEEIAINLQIPKIFK